MTGYEAYCLFSSIKMHFNDEKYDFFKYKGKFKNSLQKYENRHDKILFQYLGKKPNTKSLILSNILNDDSIWVSDCLSEKARKISLEWEKTQQSMEYVYRTDISKLLDDFNENFKITNKSNYPFIIDLLMKNKIKIETVVILDRLVNFLEVTDSKIRERIFWPGIYKKIRKYSPFIVVDKQIYKNVTVDTFS